MGAVRRGLCTGWTFGGQRATRPLRRASYPLAPYSGQPGTTVQLHACGAMTCAGAFGVTAMNPMSRIGEFGPENTTLAAPVTAPTVPSYDCGRSGPAGAPGIVIGPSGAALVNPLPARLHVLPVGPS